MAYEGYVDVVNNREISGWVYDDGNDSEPLTVEIMVGETAIAGVRADGFRADLVRKAGGYVEEVYRRPSL